MQDMNIITNCQICGKGGHTGPVEYNHLGFRLMFFMCKGCVAVVEFDAQRKLIEVIRELREEHAELFAKMKEEAERKEKDGNQTDSDTETDAGGSEADAADDPGDVQGGGGESDSGSGDNGVRAAPRTKRTPGSVRSFGGRTFFAGS